MNKHQVKGETNQVHRQGQGSRSARPTDDQSLRARVAAREAKGKLQEKAGDVQEPAARRAHSIARRQRGHLDKRLSVA